MKYRTLMRRSRAVAALSAVALATGGLAAIAPTPAEAAGPTVVSLTFDNEWSTQMIAAAEMKAAGLEGTYYIVSGWLGDTGFMTTANLNALVSDGDEIGGKTVTDPSLPTLSDPEAEREICDGRDTLLGDGYDVTDFAYPSADVNAEGETLVKECGFNSGRSVGNINSLQPGGCAAPECAYAEHIPPTDPYQINTPDDVEQDTTLSDVENEVTQAELHGGGWLVFSFHQLCDTSTTGCDPTYSWSPELFQDFVDFLVVEKLLGVQVKTVQQVIGGTEQPAVTAPAAPPAPVGTNALVNPSLTTASAASSTEPECWSPVSNGTNTPAYTWSATGGEGGGGEETIAMSDLSSGAAELITTEDLGQCAPTATTGDSYELSDYYESTVPVYFTVYGRAANGTWSYWTQSPTFAPSSGWAKAQWLTPQVPATVTALSYGMTIASNGTLSTSANSLVNIGSGVPPAAPAGTNVLQNPLLETPDGTGTNPACWTGAGYGTNTANYTWSPTGGQAGGEETIDMSSWTSGDAKLIVPLDNGNCAPTVNDGDTYTISLYYQSSVPVFITLYSRSASGAWSYQTQSAAFPAASGWTEATWTTPAVPAGVTSASFGMTIDSVGTLSTSDYSMVDNG